MLDLADDNHARFVEEFSKKIKSSAKINSLAPPGMVAYKKKDEFDQQPIGARPKSSKEQSKNNSSSKENYAVAEQKRSGKDTSKKGGKFVPLFTQDGQIEEVLLPGRNPCECQAQKHDLVGNCTKCGRIVCVQEGSGPCLFCGNLVCTREELEVINRGSKKSDQLMKKLMSDEAKTKAEQLRNKLLEFDKTSEKRTKVIDDESDYFSVDNDKWLTKDQRKKLKEREKEIWEQKHGSRLNKKYTFDFAGRKITEDTFDSTNYDPSKDAKVKEIMESSNEAMKEKFIQNISKKSEDSGAHVANPTVTRPVFIEKEASRIQNDVKNSNNNSSNKNYLSNERRQIRIQDAQLQEMRDDGWCLSMHQPWASYLVHGIKMHEGNNFANFRILCHIIFT